eukprot:CAMPEP_0184865596 /NCGR_PEP_ID=MMETSP0580-20130426/18591_1 /TAXON_ID=1118495 /ORGANISM="Dactyliosolen fragilissimus" /LENGTH=1068 /DNA_ID=CAMNT_0027364869 /DNA_START=166 /DNA_END=3372 /DNA_ORIENTATION=-
MDSQRNRSSAVIPREYRIASQVGQSSTSPPQFLPSDLSQCELPHSGNVTISSSLSSSIGTCNSTPSGSPNAMIGANGVTLDPATASTINGQNGKFHSPPNFFLDGPHTESPSENSIQGSSTNTSRNTTPKKSWERHYKSFLKKHNHHYKKNNSSAQVAAEEFMNTRVMSNENGTDLDKSLRHAYITHPHPYIPPLPTFSRNTTDPNSGCLQDTYSSNNFTHEINGKLLITPTMSEPIPILSKTKESLPSKLHVKSNNSDSTVRGGNLFSSIFKSRPKGSLNSSKFYKHGRPQSFHTLDQTLRQGNGVRTGSQDQQENSHQHNQKDILIDSSTRSHGYQGNSHNLHSSMPTSTETYSALTPKDMKGLGTFESKVKKIAFTSFHNSQKFSEDSTSSYLGEDLSVKKGNQFSNYAAFMMTNNTQVSGNGNRRTSTFGSMVYSDPKPALAPVKESMLSKHASCVLQPLEGTANWEKDQKYLIAPASLSLCSLEAFLNMSLITFDENDKRMDRNGDCQQSMNLKSSNMTKAPILCDEEDVELEVYEDEISNIHGRWYDFDDNTSKKTNETSTKTSSTSLFGKILLGSASVVQVGLKRQALDEEYSWSLGVFVLSQNYLLEYQHGDDPNGIPRGWAHLEFASIQPHANFSQALQLKFYPNTSARIAYKTVMIRVESKAQRDRWVTLLARASKLRIEDLYEFETSKTLGQGRYSAIYPGRRRRQYLCDINSDTIKTKMMSSGKETNDLSHYKNNLSSSTECLDQSIERSGGIMKKNPSYTCLLSNPQVKKMSPSDYECALKVVDKRIFWDKVRKTEERVDALVRESAVQATLSAQKNCNNTFLRLLGIFETSDYFVFELELLEGTDLYGHASAKGVLDEVEAASIMHDILTSLSIMNRIGIAHRDVKPSNVLINEKVEASGRMSVKLGDFGMSQFVGIDNLLRGRCGTPGYVAPEILKAEVNGGYANNIDIFSAGVTLYILLCGYEPFYGRSDNELIKANKKGKVDFPNIDWDSVSVEGKDLVERMLEVDPQKRIKAADALKHPWITRRAKCSKKDTVQISNGTRNHEESACIIS